MIFKVLDFLKVWPIFVGSVDNFSKSYEKFSSIFLCLDVCTARNSNLESDKLMIFLEYIYVNVFTWRREGSKNQKKLTT